MNLSMAPILYDMTACETAIADLIGSGCNGKYIFGLLLFLRNAECVLHP